MMCEVDSFIGWISLFAIVRISEFANPCHGNAGRIRIAAKMTVCPIAMRVNIRSG